MSLIGLDIGTTGCKAIVFREDGTILSQAAREYGIATPRPDWAEQDAEEVWALARSALKEAVQAAADDPPAAMALSCQGEAVLPVDGDGRAMRPVILGMDTRTTAENRWLDEQFGAHALFARTGMALHTINTLPKLLWLQRNEPEIWAAADQFLLYEDFFLRRLTGAAVISPCLASRTQMMDLANGAWATDLLDACNIDPARLAPIAPSDGGIIGYLRPELAAELGIAGPVALAAGGHDQACAALGAGVIAPGTAMVSTGTAEVVEVVLDEPVVAPALRDGGISVYRHVVPGQFLAMTLNHSGGLSLRWFRDEFCEEQMAQAAATGVDAYELMLAGAPAGPTPLMVLPHFSGSGTPTLDTDSRGAFLGMTFATDRPTVAKAILEGLTFELRINVDLLRAAAIPIHAMHAVGGGAKSPLWLQLKADICNTTLRVPEVTEAACLGAALLAGIAADCYANTEHAVSRTVRWRQEILPQSGSVAAFDERYQIYAELYPQLRGINHQLAGTASA
jgi:xylulokinase